VVSRSRDRGDHRDRVTARCRSGGGAFLRQTTAASLTVWPVSVYCSYDMLGVATGAHQGVHPWYRILRRILEPEVTQGPGILDVFRAAMMALGSVEPPS